MKSIKITIFAFLKTFRICYKQKHKNKQIKKLIYHLPKALKEGVTWKTVSWKSLV